MISRHTFYLWSQASITLTQRYKDAQFGAVPCHINEDLCSDYVTEQSDEHAIFVFRDNKNIARTQYLRDPAYYIEWVDM